MHMDKKDSARSLQEALRRLYIALDPLRVVDDVGEFLLAVCKEWTDDVWEVYESIPNDWIKGCLLRLRTYFQCKEAGQVEHQRRKLQEIHERLDIVEGLVPEPEEPEPRNLFFTVEQNEAMSALQELIVSGRKTNT